jgi:pyruvate,orthophosphate dikinase
MHRKLGVKANADTPGQAKRALTLGAEGIGLCRTEHMFFEGDRIDYMRQMILAETEVARREALAKLLPFQREDFVGLLQTMDGLPVTIRLLDPPLHEFLPNDEASKLALSKKFNIPLDKINDRISALHEQNPMLGHRGCRLGISYPEITEMQVTAIFEAVAQILKSNPQAKPCPEIMVPLVGFTSEFKHQAAIVHSVAKRVMEETKTHIHYTVGTMIEIPRAAVTADTIAEHAQFFSFGTNDLTQTTLGMSRDDMGSFFPRYVELEIVNQNPFATIDETGVGQLMDMATKRGRTTNPNLVVGICGEHGGDPKSIAFCQKIGITYVSCSPNRIPVARLAAAQAALA